jgi:hypothetical protein
MRISTQARRVPGGAARQLVALEQDHVRPPQMGQMVGHRRSDHATTDDHDASLLRKILIGHSSPPVPAFEDCMLAGKNGQWSYLSECSPRFDSREWQSLKTSSSSDRRFESDLRPLEEGVFNHSHTLSGSTTNWLLLTEKSQPGYPQLRTRLCVMCTAACMRREVIIPFLTPFDNGGVQLPTGNPSDPASIGKNGLT